MKSFCILNSSRKRQAGMTMLEVVVSMLIIGIGLAMTISMMQASNRYGASAEYRSAAMREIQSIADSMRSNALGADGYVWGQSTYQPTGYDRSPAKIPTKTAPTCSTNPCEPSEQLKITAQGVAYTRAQADMLSWLDHVATSLPGGQAAIERTDPNTNTYTATVMWIYGEESSLANPSNKNTDSISITFAI